jgi:hypothetical protein
LTSRGAFHQVIKLKPGPNTLELTATKHSLRRYTRALTIVYKEPQVHVRVTGDIRSGATVAGEDSVTLQGSVTSGAAVRVNGSAAAVTGSTWQMVIPVHLGRNSLRVNGAKPGYQGSNQAITVTRNETRSEYEASAQQVAYDELTKDSGPSTT